MAISIYGTSIDAVDALAIATFWSQVLGRDIAEGASAQSAALAVREGTGDALIMFHAVPEPRTVKNRLHLDLAASDYDTEVARLKALGATELMAFPKWTTLADPEGNEFDLIRG